MIKIKLNDKEFEIIFCKDVNDFNKNTNDITNDVYEHMLYWIDLINKQKEENKENLLDDL
jgi:hypothetical protein